MTDEIRRVQGVGVKIVIFKGPPPPLCIHNIERERKKFRLTKMENYGFLILLATAL